MRERQLSNVVTDRQGRPVNQDAVHAAPQRVQGRQHCFLGRNGDARVIDSTRGRHGEADGRIPEDELCQVLPLGCGEFLGIVNVVEPRQRLSREDDGGCGDWAGERAASCLVYAGDSARALQEQLALVGEAGACDGRDDGAGARRRSVVPRLSFQRGPLSMR